MKLQLDTSWAVYARVIYRLRRALIEDLDAVLSDYDHMMDEGLDGNPGGVLLTAGVGDRTVRYLAATLVGSLINIEMQIVLGGLGGENSWFIEACVLEAQELVDILGLGAKLDEDDIYIDRLRRLKTVLTRCEMGVRPPLGWVEDETAREFAIQENN